MEIYKVYKNKDKWDIYSVYGEFIASFKTEIEAIQFKVKLEQNYRILQFKLGRMVDD
jgi:hypothetical protein